jgi:glycosyltransferase involved in cell wall biosynthesis
MTNSANPKVIIVVPNYNHARFLRQRLDSIFRQTFQDFEQILMDDCSTDASRSIISEFANNPRVRTEFNPENSGSPCTVGPRRVRLDCGIG